MAHNLLRAAGALASLPFAKARAATIRRDLIAVAARTARHGRGHLTLHLPAGRHRRARMAEPVRRGLRPARCGGLRSPDSVRTPTAARPPRPPAPEQGNGQAAEEASGRAHAPGSTSGNSSYRIRPKRSTGIGRWIEAEAAKRHLAYLSIKAGRIEAAHPQHCASSALHVS